MSAPEATTIGVMEDRCDEAAAVILKRCRAARVWIAAAESLTGGLLADAFVRIPGASTVFLGSAVTYDIAAKASILRVNEALLRREGAVHPMVAAQMASSTARLYDQAAYRHRVIGLSTTGVAGPGPDGDKPAGLVYVGISVPVTLMPEPGSAPTPNSTRAAGVWWVRQHAIRNGPGRAPAPLTVGMRSLVIRSPIGSSGWANCMARALGRTFVASPSCVPCKS